MAGQYSHLQFFRRTPNAQLAAYFSFKVINLGIDLLKLKEKESETILQALTQLPAEQQAEIEAEFQDVNVLACEGGVAALIDEAVFHQDNDFVQAIAAIEGFHSKVMWAFLEKPDYWRGASMFLHADNVSPSFWKKRNDLPSLPPHVDDSDIDALARAISKYFYTKQGRGKNCKVEPYRRNDKEYFFAYPEDYAQSGVEWVSNTLKTLAHHPAFEIIFVYSESEGSLDIYTPRNTKAVPDLQKQFAKSILKLETLKDGKIDKRVYELKPVADSDFEFKITPESGISSVVVTSMRLTLKHGIKQRITLEADTKNNPRAVYDLLSKLNIPVYHITQLGVKVTFDSVGGRRSNARTFKITYPNSCALNHDGKDLIIRKMLAESGLEPHLQKSDNGE